MRTYINRILYFLRPFKNIRDILEDMGQFSGLGEEDDDDNNNNDDDNDDDDNDNDDNDDTSMGG